MHGYLTGLVIVFSLVKCFARSEGAYTTGRRRLDNYATDSGSLWGGSGSDSWFGDSSSLIPSKTSDRGKGSKTRKGFTYPCDGVSQKGNGKRASGSKWPDFPPGGSHKKGNGMSLWSGSKGGEGTNKVGTSTEGDTSTSSSGGKVSKGGSKKTVKMTNSKGEKLWTTLKEGKGSKAGGMRHGNRGHDGSKGSGVGTKGGSGNNIWPGRSLFVKPGDRVLGSHVLSGGPKDCPEPLPAYSPSPSTITAPTTPPSLTQHQGPYSAPPVLPVPVTPPVVHPHTMPAFSPSYASPLATPSHDSGPISPPAIPAVAEAPSVQSSKASPVQSSKASPLESSKTSAPATVPSVIATPAPGATTTSSAVPMTATSEQIPLLSSVSPLTTPFPISVSYVAGSGASRVEILPAAIHAAIVSVAVGYFF